MKQSNGHMTEAPIDALSQGCEWCQDSGRMDLLDVWEIQRQHVAHGQLSIDSAAALPMLRQAVRCPKCKGQQSFDDDLKDIYEKLGNPWSSLKLTNNDFLLNQ